MWLPMKGFGRQVYGVWYSDLSLYVDRTWHGVMVSGLSCRKRDSRQRPANRTANACGFGVGTVLRAEAAFVSVHNIACLCVEASKT